MLIPELMGGLGNMMYQLASVYCIAKQTNHSFGINNIPMPPTSHSSTDYKQNILKPWIPYLTKAKICHTIFEHKLHPINFNEITQIDNSSIVRMLGYFQNSSYLEPYKDEVLKLFDISLTSNLQHKYDDIDEAYFLHVRRGDYVGNVNHEFNLENYYKQSLSHINKGIAYIVSNDLNWCSSWDQLNDIRYRLIDENDVNTLTLMKYCKYGGIGVNSSFSWWGLYLNTNRPHLILPKKWFPLSNYYEDGYNFPGLLRIEQ